MSDEIMLMIGDDGKAALYDDTYDLTIHCESEEEQNEVKKALESIPKWIPCSERLPEIGEYVLCSQDNGDVGEGKLLDSGSWLICYDQICHGSYWVNAWMPLPEPYGGE